MGKRKESNKITRYGESLEKQRSKAARIRTIVNGQKAIVLIYL
jgi:hypothetical protein